MPRGVPLNMEPIEHLDSDAAFAGPSSAAKTAKWKDLHGKATMYGFKVK